MSEGLVDEFKKYNPNVFWLTQAFEPSFFKTDRITEKDKKIYASDVTFVGNLGSKVQYLDRRTYLGRLLHEGINFKWWGPRLPRKLSTISLVLGKLGRSYGGKFVWGEEHAKIAKLSKIYLGIDSQPHVRKSMSERLYIAVGCGAFYMCLHVDGIEEVLEPDREIVTFRDEYEMIDKIKFYLKHDSLREKIARAGQKRVMSEHIYEVRIRQMMNIVAKHL
jgi:spore maturation protein CgeB